jgi:hypothetical protein
MISGESGSPISYVVLVVAALLSGAVYSLAPDQWWGLAVDSWRSRRPIQFLIPEMLALKSVQLVFTIGLFFLIAAFPYFWAGESAARWITMGGVIALSLGRLWNYRKALRGLRPSRSSLYSDSNSVSGPRALFFAVTRVLNSMGAAEPLIAILGAWTWGYSRFSFFGAASQPISEVLNPWLGGLLLILSFAGASMLSGSLLVFAMRKRLALPLAWMNLREQLGRGRLAWLWFFGALTGVAPMMIAMISR